MPHFDDEFELSEAVQVLAQTPAVLRALTSGLSPRWFHFQEDPDAWSPRTVLIHLIHNEQTNWIPRAQIILSNAANRQFPPFRQLPESADRDERALDTLLREFAELRSDNLAILRELDPGPAAFGREAIHPVLGTVTLRQLLATWVAHDLNHLHQIAKSLAKRYREAVGPWRQNLAILDL